MANQLTRTLVLLVDQSSAATLTATATPSITLSLAPAALKIAVATASPSVTLSLGPVALKVGLAQATPSITLALNASAASLGTATPSITLSLAPVALKIGLAQSTPSITLSLAPNASAALGATTSPSITLSLAPVALKIGVVAATPSITLTLAPAGLWVARVQATPSILLSLAPSAALAQPATATPSILLTLSASTPAASVITAHTTPPGSLPIPVTITDSFDRADNAASLGTADTGQVWSALAGTWGISSNKAVMTGVATHHTAVVETGVSDMTIQVTLSPVGSGNINPGVSFRMQDVNNGLLFRINPFNAVATLSRLVAGTPTTLAGPDYTPAGTSVLKVVCAGTSVKCYVDGVLLIDTTVANFATETKHGLYAFGSPPTTWNDFSLSGTTSSPPPPSILLQLAPTAQAISTATIYTVNTTGNEQGLREAAISYRGSP